MIRRNGAVLRDLNTLLNLGVTRDLTDGQLLERFSTSSGKVAEVAFEVLVERHGAMVLRVCRAQLVDLDDTHDAFQATFLILVKKARSLWVQDSLGPWLHQVAFRTAACARLASARRRKHERCAAESMSPREAAENSPAPDWETILHEEINRLPERYRVPIVLCDLQGCTCDEAARRMGRPVGTVKSWRARGREQLRTRLIRRGVAPSAALATVLIQEAARATVPEHAIRLAVRALSNGTTAGEVSASVKMLVKGVFKTMLLSKLQATATTVFGSMFLTAAFGAVAWVMAADSPRPVAPEPPKTTRPGFIDEPRQITSPADRKAEIWSLTLREAIRIGLDNAEDINLISLGTPSTIAPVKIDVDPQEFRAGAMIKVRSIEQQYWNLVQVYSQLRSAEKAVELGREILKREQAEFKVGKGTTADVAEVEQRLEQFNLDLITRTSDVITTERHLRIAIGLPSADDRRIVPATLPVEAELKPNWEASFAAMLENHPDILRAKARVKEAEAAKPDADNRLDILQSRKESLKQIQQQTTHSLARFFLEIDAFSKQFKTASRLREAASKRLDTQRAYYEEGRITIDRFMDAVSQHCTAIASEAQFKSTYNVSIVAFEEAKGTLLDYDQIAVVEGPRSPHYAAYKPDSPSGGDTPASPPPSPVIAPPPIPATPAQPGASANPSKLDPSAGKTFSFDITVGGAAPIQIRGSFTVAPARPVTQPKG